MTTTLISPAQEQAIADAVFIRRLANEANDEMLKWVDADKVDAARVCHVRVGRLRDIADRIEASAGISRSRRRPAPGNRKVRTAAMERKELIDLWHAEFVDREAGLRGLCANTGIIRTEGVSPAGSKASITAFCICPNGRELRKRNGSPFQDNPRADLRRAAGKE